MKKAGVSVYLPTRPRSLPEVTFSTGLRYAAMCARTDAAYGESTLVHSIGVIGVSSSEVAVESRSTVRKVSVSR